MIIAVDVGNSGTKAGRFEGERLRDSARIDGDDVRTPDDLRRRLSVASGDEPAVVVVSVHERRLAEFLSGPGRGAVVLGRDLPILVENRYRDPTQVGLDRLVNCAAAHDLAGGPAVAVDLGSAVTVDAVDADGAFLGGAIGPGLPALVAGLRAAAPALPSWQREPPAPALPGSTSEAVGWGTVLGLAGLVDRLVTEVRGVVGEEAPVYLTGGDAGVVAGLLACRPVVVPHLTLSGVRILYDRARRA